jgi:hypothetical protein
VAVTEIFSMVFRVFRQGHESYVVLPFFV